MFYQNPGDEPSPPNDVPGWVDPDSEVYPDGTTSDGRKLGPPGPHGWWDPILKLWRLVSNPMPRVVVPSAIP